ncbi:hypothetical protein HII31_07856 [Pseudocercospora fuligena]|uniref:SIMPL domain-containing protein n=1 Tax=Pseudocercospora fuligena TaxID=685502 RepID=A0A8H6RH72_9PEZI|nr:hypothetical protein HII31_07856 [Pseudocercospora fuligena]
MAARFEIHLDGEANISLPAERTLLKFTVTNTTDEKSEAAKTVVSTARQVESLLIENSKSAVIDHWTRTSMTETEEYPYNHATNKRSEEPEYEAEIKFEARFQNFAAVGPFISGLSDLPHIDTEPVEWILLEETKASHRASLRAKSARNAQQKAIEYANALGYGKVTPSKLREGNVYAYSARSKSGRTVTDGTESMAKNLAGMEDWEDVKGSDTFEYQPENIKISVAVHTEFYAE